MNVNAQRSLAVCALAGAVLMLGFQNCARLPEVEDTASLTAPPAQDTVSNEENPARLSLTPALNMVPEGQQVPIAVHFENARDVSVFCRDSLSNQLLFGQLIPSSGDVVQLTVDRDILCVVSGSSIFDRRPIQVTSLLQVDCGTRTKNISTNRCE